MVSGGSDCAVVIHTLSIPVGSTGCVPCRIKQPIALRQSLQKISTAFPSLVSRTFNIETECACASGIGVTCIIAKSIPKQREEMIHCLN